MTPRGQPHRPNPGALGQRENQSLAGEIAALGPWFHNLHLLDGTQTCPDHFLGDFPRFKWRQLAAHLPARLENWSVLDIGCNAGFYSFELARRGARVVGIDMDERYLNQARWAAHKLDLADRVTFQRRHVYDLSHEQRKYDLVLFMGVFYHLRYPLLGLDTVARCVGRQLVFQTLSMPGRVEHRVPTSLPLDDRDRMERLGWPKMAFIERSLQGDPTNWWAPNRACVRALLRSTGMRIVVEPAEELYLCEPAPDEASSFWRWNAEEYWSAVQQQPPSDRRPSDRSS